MRSFGQRHPTGRVIHDSSRGRDDYACGVLLEEILGLNKVVFSQDHLCMMEKSSQIFPVYFVKRYVDYYHHPEVWDEILFPEIPFKC